MFQTLGFPVRTGDYLLTIITIRISLSKPRPLKISVRAWHLFF